MKKDFINFNSQIKYDMIFYAGVIYHNINQMEHLQKLYELASEGAYLIFESSTSRNETIKDMNVIEVFHPPYSEYYRDASTMSFQPTKLACKSMLNLAGWEILTTCEEYEDLGEVDRINILCRKSYPHRNRHLM